MCKIKMEKQMKVLKDEVLKQVKNRSVVSRVTGGQETFLPH